MEEKDMVNNPSHYGGAENVYEVVKVLEAWGLDRCFYLGSCIKYIQRAGKKDPNKYIEDLEKAKEYILKHNVKYTNINPNPFTITFDEVSKCSEGVTKCTHVQKFLSKLKGLKGSNVGKKEDFTILMFIDKGELYAINENRTYNDCSGKLPKNLTLKYFKDNDIPVYSIERNSDEVVFSLGDRIKSSNSAYGGIITKILSNGHVCVGGICFYITSVELT